MDKWPPEKKQHKLHVLAEQYCRMLAHNTLHAVKTANSADFLPTLQKILNRYISYMHWMFFFARKVNEFKNKMRLKHEYTTNQNANYINYKKMNWVCTFFFAFFLLAQFHLPISMQNCLGQCFRFELLSHSLKFIQF